jgi:hypothetical protein
MVAADKMYFVDKPTKSKYLIALLFHRQSTCTVTDPRTLEHGVMVPQCGADSCA